MKCKYIWLPKYQQDKNQMKRLLHPQLQGDNSKSFLSQPDAGEKVKTYGQLDLGNLIQSITMNILS